MKKNYCLQLLAFAVLLVFASCSKADTAAAGKNKTILMGNCVTATTAGIPVICFDSLVTDSRCPSDVNIVCVWGGYAAVKLSVKTSAGITVPFSLSTLENANFPVPPNDTTINGHHIKLINVYPYPKTPQPAPGDYTVELEIK